MFFCFVHLYYLSTPREAGRSVLQGCWRYCLSSSGWMQRRADRTAAESRDLSNVTEAPQWGGFTSYWRVWIEGNPCTEKHRRVVLKQAGCKSSVEGNWRLLPVFWRYRDSYEAQLHSHTCCTNSEENLLPPRLLQSHLWFLYLVILVSEDLNYQTLSTKNIRETPGNKDWHSWQPDHCSSTCMHRS